MPRPDRFAWALCLALALMVAPARAQQSDTGNPLVTGEPAAKEPMPSFDQLQNNGLTGFSPTITEPATDVTGEKAVEFEARLTPDAKPMAYGLSWRIFKPIPGTDGKLPLLASAEGGSASFELAPGEYFVNVAFGRAGTTKKLTIKPGSDVPKQVLVLDAGGLLLNAVSGSDLPIPAKELTFSIFSSEVRDDGERGLVMKDVSPDEVVRLNAGTYHVVSNYGEVNAVIRADIQVQAGKLTHATIQHRAAKISLKLVSSEGGEAIADTAWSILTGSGDVVYESVGAFPEMVLAEGTYTAIARNKDKLYQRDFEVKAGMNADVEVLLTQQ